MTFPPRACTCEQCGETTTVPPVDLWPGIDAIICRYCGHDLREQTIAKLPTRPAWADTKPAWAGGEEIGHVQVKSDS